MGKKSKGKVKSKRQQSEFAVTQFEVLFSQAFDLHKGGDRRAAADKFLEAVLEAPSKSTEHRFQALRSFLQILYDDRCKLCTKNDVKLIKKRFVENEKEPAVYRALAAQQIAAFYFLKERDIIKAKDKLDRALELIAESPREDDNKLLLSPPITDPNGANTVKQNLDKVKSEIKQTLYDLNVDPLTKEESQEVREIHSDFCGSNAIIDRFTREGRSALHWYTSLRIQHQQTGGSYCDCCQKAEGELEVNLLKCLGCHMTFYCSKECQTKQWKAGHNKACRKRGQIKLGDIMILSDVEGREDLDDRFVRIREPVDQSGGHLWRVEILQLDGELIEAPVESRMRLRPLV
jgi:hypothetical protein